MTVGPPLLNRLKLKLFRRPRPPEFENGAASARTIVVEAGLVVEAVSELVVRL